MIPAPPRAEAEVSRAKVGRRPDCDTATVTFTFDQPVTAWTVRVNSTSHLDGTEAQGWVLIPLGFGTIPFGSAPFGGQIWPDPKDSDTATIEAADLLHGANRVTVYGRGLDGRWTPPPVEAAAVAS